MRDPAGDAADGEDRRETVAREADGGIYQHVGPEIGVASTKAFTCQLAALACFAIAAAEARRTPESITARQA